MVHPTSDGRLAVGSLGDQVKLIATMQSIDPKTRTHALLAITHLRELLVNQNGEAVSMLIASCLLNRCAAALGFYIDAKDSGEVFAVTNATESDLIQVMVDARRSE